MTGLLVALALLVLSIPLILAIVRANELFFLRIRIGHVSIRRGRIPKRLLDDISDVVKGVDHATLRALNEGGRPRLYVEGNLGPEHKQRLKNLLGTWTVPQIRTAPRAGRR